MRSFAAAISGLIIEEYGSQELLKRLSDPLFFQALNCASAMDWHSSGSTTTMTAALKLGFIDLDTGIAGCGGKGKTSRKTPAEIVKYSDQFNLSEGKKDTLLEATRMSAKVDSSCIQDSYSLYHHSFFFDEKGNWAVIQQGLSDLHGYARRYHWLETTNFVDGPPENIAGARTGDKTLNLVSNKTPETRRISVDLVKDNPRRLQKYFTGQTTLSDTGHFKMPERHEILGCDLSKKDWEMLERAYEAQPENYKELVSLKGMGKKKLRALALVSRLIYGSKLDFDDPAKYAFAHGGKDGFPYPADRKTYDHTIRFLGGVVEGAELESGEKKAALKRLSIL
jgi:hypothetical protein